MEQPMEAVSGHNFTGSPPSLAVVLYTAPPELKAQADAGVRASRRRRNWSAVARTGARSLISSGDYSKFHDLSSQLGSPVIAPCIQRRGDAVAENFLFCFQPVV